MNPDHDQSSKRDQIGNSPGDVEIPDRLPLPAPGRFSTLQEVILSNLVLTRISKGAYSISGGASRFSNHFHEFVSRNAPVPIAG